MFAHGTWTGAAMQVIAGAGLAGTYMPGLKLIADRLPHLPRPRTWPSTRRRSRWIEPVVLDRGSPRSTITVATGGRTPAAGPISPARSSGRCCVQSRSESTFTTRRTGTRSSRRATPCVCGRLRRPRVGAVRVACLGGSLHYVLRDYEGIGASGCGVHAGGRDRIDRRACQPGRRRADRSPPATPSRHPGDAGFGAREPVRRPAAGVSWTLLIAAVCVYSAFISADSAALTSGVLDVAPVASRGTAMAVYSTVGFAAASAGRRGWRHARPDGRPVSRELDAGLCDDGRSEYSRQPRDLARVTLT